MKCRLKAFSYTWILALFGMDSCRILVKKKKKRPKAPKTPRFMPSFFSPRFSPPLGFNMTAESAITKQWIKSVRFGAASTRSSPVPIPASASPCLHLAQASKPKQESSLADPSPARPTSASPHSSTEIEVGAWFEPAGSNDLPSVIFGYACPQWDPRVQCDTHNRTLGSGAPLRRQGRVTEAAMLPHGATEAATILHGATEDADLRLARPHAYRASLRIILFHNLAEF